MLQLVTSAGHSSKDHKYVTSYVESSVKVSITLKASIGLCGVRRKEGWGGEGGEGGAGKKKKHILGSRDLKGSRVFTVPRNELPFNDRVRKVGVFPAVGS